MPIWPVIETRDHSDPATDSDMIAIQPMNLLGIPQISPVVDNLGLPTTDQITLYKTCLTCPNMPAKLYNISAR